MPKYVHITCNGTTDSVLLQPGLSEEEVRDVLLSAANATARSAKNGALKLTQADGTSIPIGPSMPENTKDTAYTLQLIGADNKELGLDNTKVDGPMSTSIGGEDVEEIKEGVLKLKNQLAELDDTPILNSKFLPTASKAKKVRHIREESKYVFTDESRELLKQPTFDSWQWEENEMISLLELMFQEMGLLEAFNIEERVLRRFLHAIKDNYQDNPFHNFRHCFCVTQMMYGILNVTDLKEKLNPVDMLILTVSCIGHDLDHPGYNNAYQVNAKTDLAVIYSDASPLENHHCAMLFTILRSSNTNILRNVPDAMYRDIRKGIIRCILSTDMAKHGEIMGNFKKCLESFSYGDPDHKSMLLQVIIKCADISNEVRPASVAEPWVDCLLEEFFMQSDREKMEGLPTAPFMDRDKVTKPSAQVGFIGFVMIPLFELVAKVLPQMEERIIIPIRRSLAYYKDMQERQAAGGGH